MDERPFRPRSDRPSTAPDVVHIGGLDKPALLASLRDHHVQLNQAALALFADPRFEVTPERRTIAITTLSVADLGFGSGATYDRLTTRALELGWVECPLDVGAHLRTQYLDQPEGAAGAPSTKGRAPPGSITVASTPLDDTDETPKGFYLRRIDGVLWLRGYNSWAGHPWSPEDVFVFARADR